MVPPTLRDVYLAMAARRSHPRPDPAATAWDDTQELLYAQGMNIGALYVRVQCALAAVRSAYLGTGCLTAQGREYLGLPAMPAYGELAPRSKGTQ